MGSPAFERHLAVLRLIREAGQLTRRGIAERTGLSVSLVSRLTNELIGRQLIRDVGKSESDGGRPSDLLALNPRAGYVVGLDVGSTRQRAVIADLRGDVVTSLVEPTVLSTERDEILLNIEDLIDRAIGQVDLDRGAILGLGLGLRAIVDPTAGVVRNWPNTPAWSPVWSDFPVRDLLAARLPWHHIAVEDTVRALGLAEARYGHGAQEPDFIFVLAGTGIGAAIVLGGLPYLGPNHVSGEIGHIRVADAALPCKCGNAGCLETVASSPAIVAQALRRLTDSQMLTVLRRKGDRLGIADIVEAGESGDRLAYQILTEAGEYLGSALAVVLNLLGPRLVVAGGPLATSTAFLDATRRMLKLRSLTQASHGVVLERSLLDDLAGARGTATIVLDALFGPHASNLLAMRRGDSAGARQFASVAHA